MIIIDAMKTSILNSQEKISQHDIEFSINNFILESYKNHENTIIYSPDYMIGLIIIVQLIIQKNISCKSFGGKSC